MNYRPTKTINANTIDHFNTPRLTPPSRPNLQHTSSPSRLHLHHTPQPTPLENQTEALTALMGTCDPPSSFGFGVGSPAWDLFASQILVLNQSLYNPPRHSYNCNYLVPGRIRSWPPSDPIILILILIQTLPLPFPTFIYCNYFCVSFIVRLYTIYYINDEGE